MERENWKLINFCENDKFAIKSYCAIHNVDENLNLGDINQVDGTKLDSFNMIVGGSPCQDFSVAGNRKGSVWTCKDCGHEYNPLTVHWSKRGECPQCQSKNIEKTRSSLLVEFLRMIRDGKPDFGVYENVKNIVGKQFKDTTFKLFEDELREYGYNTYWKVLNTKNYGIPQNRERLYMVFIKNDLDNGKFTFPEGCDTGIRLKDVLEDSVDEKYYISDEKVKKFLQTADTEKLLKLCGNPVIDPQGRKNKECSLNEVCPTLRAESHGNLPQVVEKNEVDEEDENQNNPERIGNVYSEQFGTGYAGNIYDTEKVAPTLTCMTGGGRQPHVIQVGNIVNTGNFNNPQRGRIYLSDGCSPSLNTCQGGGLEPKIIQIGKLNSSQDGVVVDEKGIAPTLTSGHGNMPKVLQNPDYSYCIAKNYNNVTLDQYFNRKHGQLVFESCICNDGKLFRIRIRKLTPKECFRLQGFDDLAFESAAKVNSNSQLYKQAGNSITVDVLYYIFLNLYEAMPYLFDDLRLSSFFSGIGAFECALDRLYETINTGKIYKSVYGIKPYKEGNVHEDNYNVLGAAMRSRLNADGNFEQKMEVNSDGISNCLSTF